MTTYYMDPNGNDTDDGSINSPWKNLRKAVGSSTSGDTIIIKQGTYLDQDEMESASSEFRIKSLNILGETEDPRDTILDFNQKELYLFGTLSTSTDVFNLKNVTMRNTINPNRSFFSAMASVATIENCIFKNISGNSTSNSRGGNAFFQGNDELTIKKCLFHNCYCTLGNFASFLQFDQQFRFASVLSCVFYQDGLNLPANTRPINYFILADNDDTIGFTVKNCIFFSPNDEIRYTSQTPNLTTTFENCIVNGFTGFNSNSPFINTLTSDPLFIDADNGIFELDSGSPAIGLARVN